MWNWEYQRGEVWKQTKKKLLSAGFVPLQLHSYNRQVKYTIKIVEVIFVELEIAKRRSLESNKEKILLYSL